MNRKGVTLIELLLYIAVSAIVLFSAFTFMSLMLQSKTKAVAIVEVESQGMNLLQEIDRVIRNADKIISPEPQDSTDELVLGKSGHEYTYRLDHDRLYLSIDGGEFTLLHSDKVEVSKIIFRNLSFHNTPPTIQIYLTMRYLNQEQRKERHYEKSFYSSATLRKIP